MNITQFTMEEVRCFGGRQAFEIRPLTFLVGENSTGKTTALGCFQVLADFVDKGEVDFNAHSYSMGTFRDIVRRSRKPEKRFILGFSIEVDGENVDLSAEFIEKANGIEPTVGATSISFVDGEIFFEIRQTAQRERESTLRKGKTRRYSVIYGSYPSTGVFQPFFNLSSMAREGQAEEFDDEMPLSKFLGEKYDNNKSLYRLGVSGNLNALSTAPIRSRPRRTYDPTRDVLDPEGSNIPTFLMGLVVSNTKEWEKLSQQLSAFGKSSGLFSRISVKNLGSSKVGPFQLRVKVRGPTVSFSDVGYGVSQVFPILVNILDETLMQGRSDVNAMPVYHLMQQPEVHLHPRAQAEFSSLLVRLANLGSQTFLVETHSDYMVDRARIEIMKGNISKDDVSLIYLEPKRNTVKVHNISFDEKGNMIGVPPHFREFFLLESDRLMGFAD